MKGEEEEEKRDSDVGLWIGMGSLIALGLLLSVAWNFISKHLDGGWADIILAIPIFAGVFLIFPVRNAYETFAKRRRCERLGHVFTRWNDTTRGCERCYKLDRSLDK